MKSSGRSLIEKLLTTFPGLVGFNLVAKAQEKMSSDLLSGVDSPDVTLYPGSLRYGNLVFVSGTGADAESVFEINADTDLDLKKMEKRLLAAGSSMEKVLN